MGWAQTVVFTGVAQSSDYGYTEQQRYSFSFTFSAAGWAARPGEFTAGSSAHYSFAGVDHGLVAGGSGLVGAYVPGTFSPLSVYGTEWWSLEMTGTDTGLTFLNGGSITSVVVELHSAVSGALPAEPVSFADALAVYGPTFLNGIVLARNDDQIVEFVIDGVTITPAAVPEPGAYAGLAGAAMLAVVGLIRRRRPVETGGLDS